MASIFIGRPAVVSVAVAPTAATVRLRLLVPAYFYPAGDGRREWDRLVASAAPDVPIVAIANPASGPGTRADPNYIGVLERASRRRGLTLIGYVDTDYGRRPRAEVEQDVTRWMSLYPGRLRGIFFDQQPSGADALDYFVALRRAVRARIPGAPLVVTNPGTLCVEEYVSRPAADVACIFENREGFDAFEMPAWGRRYRPERFAVLSYNAPDPQTLRRHLARARDQKVGHVYVTDAGGANPWDRLPRYWDEEVAAVRRANGRADGR